MRPEHTTTELARLIDNSISGTHDLVSGLEQIGLLRKVARGRYRLGPLVATLYRALEDSSALVEAARPVMDQLAADHGETLHLTMHDQGRLLVVTAVEGSRPLRVSREVIGPWLPLHDCPPGLLHLSGLSHVRLEAWLDEHARPGGPIASRSRFRSDLAMLAKEGFSLGPLTTEPDVICAAALVQDHAHVPQAVLSMSVPRSRHERQPRAFRTITYDAAIRISRRLGYDEARA